MGRVPQHFIDDLLARIDIVEVIERYVPLKKRGREHIACCPFHNEKTPSFTVSQDKQFYHCFGCGAHGTALGFLLDYEHLEFVEAVESLAEGTGLEIPRDAAGENRGEQYGGLYQILEEATLLYKQGLRESPHAIEYLKNRGLTGEIARQYGLGYALASPQHLLQRLGQSRVNDLVQAGLIKQDAQGRNQGRFRNRIMFPIHDRRGRVVGFGGRVLDASLPKYLNSPETPLFRKSESLYGLYELRKHSRKPQRVLLVEGYMDVLALAQYGIDNAVASLGTATTSQHLQQIFRVAHEVVFCFDGDRAGREAAWRATQHLLPIFRDGLEARFMFLPDGDDPDSLVRRESKDGFIERSMAAVPLAEYLFKHLAEGLDTRDAAGRARLAELAKPVLQTLPDGVFKELMYKELADQVGTSIAGKQDPPAQLLEAPQRARGARLTINSPVRMAIAILLQQPAVAQQISQPIGLEHLKLPGISLLLNILETLRIDPHLTAASMLERYRHSEHHAHLLRLAVWQPPASEDFDLAMEFRDSINRLSARALAQRTNSLLSKEREEGLDASERLELEHLLKRKSDASLPVWQESR